MSNAYAEAAQKMQQARARWEAVIEGIPPEDRKRLAQRFGDPLAPTGEQELAVRREWAEKIYNEFNPYHEHGSGECGACGAIQAARFMYPDLEV